MLPPEILAVPPLSMQALLPAPGTLGLQLLGSFQSPAVLGSHTQVESAQAGPARGHIKTRVATMKARPQNPQRFMTGSFFSSRD
jgi:hypothetical protein